MVRTLVYGLLLAGAVTLGLVAHSASQDPADGSRHRVSGKIAFSYDYPATLAAAKENGKPILAYFTFAN